MEVNFSFQIKVDVSNSSSSHGMDYRTYVRAVDCFLPNVYLKTKILEIIDNSFSKASTSKSEPIHRPVGNNYLVYDGINIINHDILAQMIFERKIITLDEGANSQYYLYQVGIRQPIILYFLHNHIYPPVGNLCLFDQQLFSIVWSSLCINYFKQYLRSECFSHQPFLSDLVWSYVCDCKYQIHFIDQNRFQCIDHELSLDFLRKNFDILNSSFNNSSLFSDIRTIYNVNQQLQDFREKFRQLESKKTKILSEFQEEAIKLAKTKRRLTEDIDQLELNMKRLQKSTSAMFEKYDQAIAKDYFQLEMNKKIYHDPKSHEHFVTRPIWMFQNCDHKHNNLFVKGVVIDTTNCFLKCPPDFADFLSKMHIGRSSYTINAHSYDIIMTADSTEQVNKVTGRRRRLIRFDTFPYGKDINKTSQEDIQNIIDSIGCSFSSMDDSQSANINIIDRFEQKLNSFNPNLNDVTSNNQNKNHNDKSCYGCTRFSISNLRTTATSHFNFFEISCPSNIFNLFHHSLNTDNLSFSLWAENKNKKLSIEKIERVCNPNLAETFMLKRKQSENKYVAYGFHGTGSTDPRAIINSGLDPRYSSKDYDLYLGAGSYISENALYCHSGHYVYKNKDGNYEILIICFLPGKSYPEFQAAGAIAKSRKKAPENYDTVHCMTQHTQIWATYDRESTYPLYLLTYSVKDK